MLHIHQYRVGIIYKPCLDLYITDWLSRNNHTEDKDQKITGMNTNTNAISPAVNMPVCTSIDDIKVTTHKDTYLLKLKSYIIHGWLHKKDELEQSIRH